MLVSTSVQKSSILQGRLGFPEFVSLPWRGSYSILEKVRSRKDSGQVLTPGWWRASLQLSVFLCSASFPWEHTCSCAGDGCSPSDSQENGILCCPTAAASNKPSPHTQGKAGHPSEPPAPAKGSFCVCQIYLIPQHKDRGHHATCHLPGVKMSKSTSLTRGSPPQLNSQCHIGEFFLAGWKKTLSIPSAPTAGVNSACSAGLVACQDHRDYPCFPLRKWPIPKQPSDGVNKRNYENYIIFSGNSGAFWEASHNPQHETSPQTRSRVEQEA